MMKTIEQINQAIELLGTMHYRKNKVHYDISALKAALVWATDDKGEDFLSKLVEECLNSKPA